MGQEPEVVEASNGWNENLYIGGFKICTNPPPDLPWSVILDNGTDLTAKEIYITAPLSGRVDLNADNAKHPRYWLEGAGRVSYVEDVLYVDAL